MSISYLMLRDFVDGLKYTTDTYSVRYDDDLTTHIDFNMAGIDPSAIELKVVGDELVLNSGKKTTRIVIPEILDRKATTAKSNHGLLTVTIPPLKKEEHKIQILS